MAAKKGNKSDTTTQKMKVDTIENSPMGKFHKAMQKIVSVPKSKLKDK